MSKKRLTLNLETLRRLDTRELDEVQGGGLKTSTCVKTKDYPCDMRTCPCITVRN